MDKLIITAAICGAEVTKEQNPAVPYTVEEIVREAKSAVDAGAAIATTTALPPRAATVSRNAKKPSSKSAPTSFSSPPLAAL